MGGRGALRRCGWRSSVARRSADCPAEAADRRAKASIYWATVRAFSAADRVVGADVRVLTVIDIFSRFSPALEPRFTFRGTDVVAVLERVSSEVGFPTTIRADQGSEFVSRDLDLWAY